MSRTFLTLCQDIVADLGIAGGSIGSVTGALPKEQQNIVNWVARADLYVQNLWSDWKFLWYMDTAAAAADTTDFVVTAQPSWAANIQTYDLENVWINYGTNSAQRLLFMPWEQFFALYQVKPKTPQLVPSFFSVDPTGQVWLSNTVIGNTAFAMQYWCIGNRMVNNGDMSPIPNNFDTIITERAKIIYAGRENAPEILTSASAEYSDQLDKLQAYGLMSNVAGRKSMNNRSTVPESYVE